MSVVARSVQATVAVHRLSVIAMRVPMKYLVDGTLHIGFPKQPTLAKAALAACLLIIPNKLIKRYGLASKSYCFWGCCDLRLSHP
jgi:hypothetical protein